MKYPTQLALTLATMLLVAAAWWSISAPALAAEAEDATETAAADDPDSEATSEAPSGEVFIPTEEISEDFAVSFPVDI